MPEIRDLAVIGDRHTAALITRDGSIVWYCPQRFDCPSLFAALLDLEKGGVWTIALPGTVGSSRSYVEESGALETRNDFADLEAIRLRLALYEELSNQSPMPFQWKFDRTKLAALLAKIEARQMALADTQLHCLEEAA